MESSLDLYSTASTIDKSSKNRRIIRSLQYLLMTWPNIAFAVNRLLQYVANPNEVHWCALKRVMWYLLGTQTLGVFLGKITKFSIHAFSDPNWGGDSTN